jgi:hypothetical protein
MNSLQSLCSLVNGFKNTLEFGGPPETKEQWDTVFEALDLMRTYAQMAFVENAGRNTQNEKKENQEKQERGNWNVAASSSLD